MSEDELLGRLRERAGDPARRIDLVSIPLGELKRTTDPELAGLRQRLGHEPDDLRTIVPAGSPEAVAFHRSTSHEPPRPPLDPAELRAIEERLGVELPALLLRLYTEIADGGFGPAYGILGLGADGHRSSSGRTAAATYATWTGADPDYHGFGLPLVDAGCGMFWFLSIEESGVLRRTGEALPTPPDDAPRLWDPATHDRLVVLPEPVERVPADGSLKLWDPNPLHEDDPPERGILLTVPSLQEWLEDWLAGRDRLLEEG